jgi:hypothetical protein
MGGSDWSYVVAYGPDLNEVLQALRERVFRDEDYYWYDDDERPASIEELWHIEFASDGTHSILDVGRVVDADGEDVLGAIRPLSTAERQRWFGTDTPTRADFDRASEDVEFTADPPRWSGRCVVLYRDGNPGEIAFWGCSGD